MHIYVYVYKCVQACVPLLTALSPRPPQSDSDTAGGSIVESDRHSVPLSVAALPTDWGEPDRTHPSSHCSTDSLHTHIQIPIFTPINTAKILQHPYRILKVLM